MNAKHHIMMHAAVSSREFVPRNTKRRMPHKKMLETSTQSLKLMTMNAGIDTLEEDRVGGGSRRGTCHDVEWTRCKLNVHTHLLASYHVALIRGCPW